MPVRDWRFRIEDIINAMEKIADFTRDADFDTFAGNAMSVDAVIRNLEVIGEAARHIPAEIEAKHPDVGWQEMRAIRNILIHEYFGIDLTIVWQTIREDLPSVMPKLRRILAGDE
jgi:uncharacterized protein with HEPN domain